MIGVLFALSEYNRAAVWRFRVALEALVLEHEPSLRAFRVEEREAVPTAQVPVGDREPLIIEPSRNQRVVRFDPHRVVAGDLNAVLEVIDVEAKWLAGQRLAYMRKHLERLTKASGQTVRVSGPMDWEHVMAAAEQAPVDFDQAGKPTFRLWPDEAQAAYEALPPRTPEQEERWQELMDRKRDEARARKRDRRLG